MKSISLYSLCCVFMFFVSNIYSQSKLGDKTVEQVTTNDITSVKVSSISANPSGEPPFVGFDWFGPLGGCAPTVVNFVGYVEDATSILWFFPGGTPSTSTAIDPVVTYTTPGVYDVTFTATNAFGTTTLTHEDLVKVYASVTSNFTFVVNGSTVSFTNTDSPIGEVLWNFGDNTTSTSINPTHTYANDGLYFVTCNASNQCNSNATTKFFTIISPPSAAFSISSDYGCQPLFVTMQNQSSTNATSYQWSFPGGTPATSTEVDPIVQYNTSGNYTISLTVTNSLGSSSVTQTKYLDMDPLPIANFTKSTSAATVNFTNTSLNMLSPQWSFGDGSTSIEVNPVHNYVSNGTFNVSLTALNSCGSNTKTSQVVIAQPPVASFTHNATGNGCAPYAVSFFSTSTYSPNTYAWEFEGGVPATSTLANPSVVYPTTGSFDVRLVVTNAFGQSESFQANAIVVNTIPSISYFNIPDGLTYTFTATPINGVFTAWNFGDNTQISYVNPVIHTYASPGTYIVTSFATNGCGSISSSQTITAQLAPSAGYTTSSTSICSGNTIQFTNQSSPSTSSWMWVFEGGNPSTSTDQNPIVSYANPGVFDVSLTVANTAGQNTLAQADLVTINTAPSSGFTVGVATNQITLTNTGIGATSTTWNMSSPNGSTQLTGNPVIFTAPSNGEFIITQTNQNNCGNSDISTQLANVNAYVNAAFSMPNAICEDTNITFNNSSVNQTANVWEFIGGSPSTSTDLNPSVSYQTPGSYLVRLIVSNILGQDTSDLIVNVGFRPLAGYTYLVNDATSIFTYIGGTGNTVSWNFGDNTTSTDLNPQHIYAQSGTYTVHQISTNTCGSDTSTQLVTIIITSNQDYDVFGANIYPIPSQGQISVVLSNSDATKDLKFTITDVYGREVYRREMTTSDKYELYFNHLVTGTYILDISNGDLRSNHKLLIK